VLIPAREVILATRRPEEISVQNVLPGVVEAVGLGNGNARVQVRIGDIQLLSRVTRDTVERLRLTPGASVFALVKAASIERPGPV
jgi:molybdate transport system ATP-binding protein